tara:strand:+ start:36 stop:599 length:564 start_codon:yes stop_codon:yes gene_type:complete
MRVLIACEYSGIVRDAFRARGHNAMSCDLLSTDEPGPHYHGSVEDILADGWDLMIAHPPCTYLTNSGVRWLHTEPGRWEKLDQACALFNLLLKAPIDQICVENPIPHKYALERLDRGYTQIVQPWQFGHGETKATCLWLKGLWPLQAREISSEREQRIHRLPPSPDRWKIRSQTYQGIANAMAEQWG